jgi:hypothetical protein
VKPTHPFRLLFAVALAAAAALFVTQSEPAFAQTRECVSWGHGAQCGWVPGRCDLWGCEPGMVFRWEGICPDRPISGPSCTGYGGGSGEGPPAIESTPGSDPES